MKTMKQVTDSLKVSRTHLYHLMVLCEIIPEKKIRNGKTLNIFSVKQVSILKKGQKDHLKKMAKKRTELVSL